MKRIVFLFVLIFSIHPLSAQETGTASATAAEASKSSNWQNWAFASSALVTATLGVVIISLSSGTNSH